MTKSIKKADLRVMPDPKDPRLTERVSGIDQTGAPVEINVPVERAVTLYLNAQEIVTMMTIKLPGVSRARLSVEGFAGPLAGILAALD